MYTNTVPASSYRGFGAAQVTFPAESQLEEMAEKLGEDPTAFRLKNLAQRGEAIYPGMRPIDADVPSDLRYVAQVLDQGGPLTRGHGRALGASASDAGSHPVTSAIVQVYSDNSISVLSGSTEIGPGTCPTRCSAQIAAEEMGVALEKVRVVGGDTTFTPFERSTGASRTTTLMGRAVLEACREAIAQLRNMAAESLGVPADEPVEELGGLRLGAKFLSWGNIVEEILPPQRHAASSAGRICGRWAILKLLASHSGKSGSSAWKSMWTRTREKSESIGWSPWEMSAWR